MRTTIDFKRMEYIGKVECIHRTSSGKEIISFYLDSSQNKLYQDIRLVDPYDGCEAKLSGTCPLPREEVQRLVSLGTVTDYIRFYFGSKKSETT